MKRENVHSCFSRIASELPTNIAIAAGPRQISYRELEERSNSLANFLLANGASAAASVAVLTNDRVAILIAILGILKARCVFAPLDQNTPEKRLAAMISLLEPEWFITETQFLGRVNNLSQETRKKARVVCVDNETAACCLDHVTVLTDYRNYFNPAEPRVEAQPDDMCYVYFTSGSTDQPKAIAGRLKGVDHLIRWEIETLGLGADARVSQILPPSVDGSLCDIFIPLCAGGTACVPKDNDTLLDTKELIAWLDRERISVIHCNPSLFRSLLNEPLTAGDFQSLKYILLAGEPLLPADVKRWTHIFGERIQLINLYGPPETTVAKFAYFVKASDQERRTIPIGKPIEGAAAMVVDKSGRPCPRGTIGEIYIRTPYRALGYYNQPELTRASFIQNPFSNDPNDIVYKTGHLGRVLEDGNFEYLGSALEQTREGLREDAALVTGLANKKLASHAPAVEPAKRASRQFPLSFAQQRLWFIDQLEPDSWAYNSPLAVRLTGRLDVDALKRTLSEIVRRHEALRTAFSVVDETPVQIISPAADVPLPLIDLSILGEDEREAEARVLANREFRGPFDLSSGPLLRAVLLKLSEQQHIALLTMHHIISDGWSLGVLIREVVALYDAYARGEQSPLPELRIQYADYAVWQREQLQGEVLEEGLSYWREQLRDAPTLELPTDRPRPARQSYRGSQLTFEFSSELTEKLRDLSRREGVTLFMTLLSGWQTLLARYSGQWDLSVGTPIANRTRGELEELIGFFVNTLVLRTRLNAEASFHAQLKQVREVCLGAYAHQDVPFEMVVEGLQPERHSSHSPLFQVMFALENVPLRDLELPGLKLEPVEGELNTTRFDLIVNMTETPAMTALTGTCEYSTDLYEATTIRRMLEHWQVLLESAVTGPEQSLSALPLLTEAERQQLLEWNETAAEYPREQTIHGLFAEQAARTATAVAVEYEGARLSYEELNRRTNQLAHHLRGLGVGPEVRVGLCMERSLEMVVGLLGILKAGGAYVPLDREYPQERLRFMIADAQLRFVLTGNQADEQALAAIAAETGVQLVQLSAAEISAESEAELESDVTADNLAYVIYTSGSTGTPKGVEVAHRAVLRLVLNTDYVQLRPTDRVAQAATISFDASTFEVWGALLNGATVVVLDKEITLEPERFAAALNAQRISALFLTTALFNQLVQTDAAVFAPVGTVLFGGEAVDPRWVRAVLENGPPERLLHVYGPTEVTTFSTWQLVTKVADDATTVPIGRPIANTQAYVLDESLQLTPVGVNGELYLGGDGLARGYLNRAELTAERFVPHPYARRAGERLYRTGDVVRHLADGAIEFVGRRDSQVKLRGFRIELSEIETVLSQYPAVREVVAIIREPQPGKKQLVAYVAGEASATELRRYLKEKLPEYMAPQAIVKLESLPLTANGKVDRQALPAPEQVRDEAAEGNVAPRTAEEELLANIWAEVLEVERVSVHDNFFALGGHSLLATQVVSRVRALFRIELPLRALFDTATLAELAQLIVAERQADVMGAAPPIERRREDTAPALSYAQQRLWFLDQFEPDSPFYNVPAAMNLSGELDTTALSQSLSEIARRHEVLRTTFPSIAGQPVQHIAPPTPIDLPIIDLEPQTKERRDAAVRTLVAEEAARPFDLAHGPVWRALLVRLDEQEHVLLLNMHHIVTDGWSVGVLIRELSTLYESYSRAEAPLLTELPIQYADFAVWQREWLQGEVLEEQMSYWREQLSNAPTLELPTDRPRPARQSYRGSQLTFEFSSELTEKLRDLSRREGVTLFMTLLSGWQTLLARYSGQWDLSVGTPIANRTRGELEELIGFFVNTLVLRTRLNAAASFREQLKQVREVCLAAYAHQDVPFEMVVEELQPERHLSRSPLFQVMFALQNAPVGELQLPGLKLKPVEGKLDTTKFDLSLMAMETETGLVGWFDYSIDLFDEATVARMLEHWQVLLERAVANPDQSLSTLPLLTEAERQQLLEWTETAVEYPLAQTMHDLFTERAARTPAAVAVEYEGVTLNYAQLNERANQLAHYLRRLGVGPETLVGVLMERSVEMIVGLLGILKAGGAYVPLDPQYPEERLAYLLNDAELKILLTQKQLAEILPDHSARRIFVDADWPSIALESTENPAPVSGPENLVYVIYTSGSTGRPKGAMATHKGVVNCLRWMQETYQLTESDRFLFKASLNFDPSVWEIFWPLWVGASVVIVRPGGQLDTAYLVDTIIEHGITTAYFVPSMLNFFLEEQDLETIHSLRQVICGGESLPGEMMERFFARWSAALHHSYGPTETSIAATEWICQSNSRRQNAPIGRPLANTEIYLLDSELQLVPQGVLGELFIGGVGVGRGYLGRPHLTAERFIPNPFAGKPGERLYRTGDLVRYLPDGNLEFKGRVDQQVKLRGYRIELGEIETVLAQHPEVREAIAVIREAHPGNKQLVAYVVGNATTSDLRRYLKEKLPDYMAPQVFVRLDQLPLMANGKVDRKALPAPERVAEELGYVAPRTPEEELLANIWAEVLEVPQVSVHDNFFDVGGHSLLATQVTSRIKTVFNLDLPVRSIFEWPTVAELAQEIATMTAAVSGARSVPAGMRVSRDGPLPLSFAQQRLWFLHQLEPHSTVYNMHTALHIRGPLNIPAFKQTINEIIRRHEVLRTIFETREAEPFQIILPPQQQEFSTIDLRHLHAEERLTRTQQLAAIELRRPFDLAQTPPFRMSLMMVSEDEHLVTFTMHHVVADGWAMGLLIKEMTILYESFSRNEPSPLPELSLQYADFASWQREWLQGEVLDTQLDYWKQRLAGAPAALELPTDRPRPATQTYHGSSATLALSRSLSEALKELSKAEGATLFMTLLAAYNILLHRYTNQADILVGTDVANRNRREIEPLLGFFINQLVMRTDLSGDPTFRELLGRVREISLEAYAHQDLPFEKLVEAVQPERHLSRSPLFQTKLLLQNFPTSVLDLRELTLTFLDIERNSSPFDLVLAMTDGDYLTGWLQYSTELFDESTIKRMLKHYETLLEAIAANPEQRISELSLLDEAELDQLLRMSTGARESYPADTCVHKLIEPQVEKTPDAIALVFEDHELSYAELNRRANQLAHYLRNLGVVEEMVVGLCLERNVEMIVAVLGILKSGAAFLPLDPSYPMERIAFMLEDAQVAVLLSQESLLDSLPSHLAQVVCVDSDAEMIAAESAENPLTVATAENLAYVIYTSGSTGKPKGVMIRHGGLCNLIEVKLKTLDIRPESRVLQFASLSFDVSIFEIFMTLPAGATLVLGRREVLMPGGELETLLRRQRVTTATLPPTVLRVLDEEQETLTVAIAAGEHIDKKTADRWRQRSNGGRLMNAYGPTETTCATTLGEIGPVVTIGKPIANSEIYIISEGMQPAPIGVAGELYLGGVGIARGYLYRPELTAEKFIPNPFDSHGGRLYRTGDLGRWLANGEIEFLGRIDHQVKIRGYRIEAGEIETVLNSHPDVVTSLVMARADDGSEKQLVAYYVSQHGEQISTSLRDYLKQSLPEYMIPAVFVMLDALPLTPNGKVDRKALPSPDKVKAESMRAFVAPRNATEELLAGIWSEVLKVPDVGINDNFFELGGDSILSIQIVVPANRAGLKLTTKQLFQYQTIAELAAHAGTTEAEEAILDAIMREPFALISAADRARMPAEIEDAYPLAMMQAGMIFHSEFTPEAPLYHSITSLHLRAPFHENVFRKVVADLAAIHEVMRTSFDLTNFSEPLQLVHQDVDVPIGVTDLRALSEAAQEEALAQWLVEEQRSFSWGDVPMVRFHLHRRTDDTFQFTFTAHHAIFDGWSDGLFLSQLFQQYVTLIKDKQSAGSSMIELAPLASRYRDFVALERATLAAPDARAYWHNVVSESKPTRIPRWPQNGEQSFAVTEAGSGVVHSVAMRLDEGVSEGLRELARRAGVPVKTVLLAAHLRVLSSISGERDVVTGLVSNGRPETADGHRVIGLFLNTLPFRLLLDGGTWEELLEKTFRAERESLPYRRYPLSQIQRENGGQALFDTCFNYVHFHILDEVSQLNEIEVLGVGGVADTNFALLVTFQLRTEIAEIDVSLACDESKISAEQTRLIGDYYKRVLETMAEAQEEEQYDRYSILSEAQQHKLLVELNQTERAYPDGVTIQRLFEMQVAQTPGAVALVSGDERLTYSELNERANQLAHHLVALGISAEQRVGILSERSTAMVVSILAVLKAGGCYVPLDPQYPAERLSFMMMDAGLTIVLTTRAVAQSVNATLNLENNDHVKLVYVDKSDANGESTENLTTAVSERQLAYVIYTSGSTGVPKGVAIAHESAVRFIQWASEIFASEALGGVLFSTSICFDLSIFELFVTLSNGGKVIVAENALELAVLPAANEVTLVNTVPSAMAELVRTGAVPKSVRVANLAGEPLSKELVAEVYAKTGVDVVYNLYGPSEGTTYSTFTAVKANERVTIGRPVANTRVYLLDESGHPVPLGVVGELYLGGAGLARGYWERPELTAERFIPDGFSGESGARLYRTGDLARYAENGEIEFLGRADHQVKVRGYRIELGEIESVLRSLSGVRDAVVVARGEPGGSQQLVAYVVRDTAVSSVELREQLSQRLPDYMIPSAFVMLAELPLTPNGKIDRKALPAADDSRPETVAAYVAPREMVEFQLVRLWEELLPVRPIGVRDSFFALGGHSLVAVRLVLRIEQEFGKKLPIRAVFQGATIEYLAGLLRQETVKAPPLVQLRSGHKLPIICVPPAGGSIFNYFNLAQHLDSDQPLYALHASGMDDDEPAPETIEAMATDYLSAIREAGIKGPYFLGGWSMGGVVAFEMARQLRAEGNEVAGLWLIDSAVPTADTEKNVDEMALLTGFAQNIGLRADHVAVSPDKLLELSTDEKLALILNWARQEHLLPLNIELAEIQRYFNVYCANVLALSRYSPRAERVRVTLFKAEEHVTQNGKGAALGWDALTEEEVEVRVIPGNHYTLLSEPHVGVLAEHLQAWLNKAEGVCV